MSHTMGKEVRKCQRLHLSAVDHIFILFLQKEMKSSVKRGINSTKKPLHGTATKANIWNDYETDTDALFLVKAYNKLVE